VIRESHSVVRAATWSVRAVMALGLSTLAPRAGVPAMTAAVGLVLLGLGWWVGRPERWPVGWRLANAMAAVGALVLVFALSRPWGEVAMLLVVYLMVHRAWTAASPPDHRVALLLSYLLLLLGSTLTDSIWLGPIHLGMVAMLPVCLLMLQLWDVELLRPERGAPLMSRRRGLGLVATIACLLLVMGGIFLSLPRLQAGAMARWGSTTSLSGFSDAVELGDLGAIQDDPTPVLQVKATRHGSSEPVLPPVRLRGVALDHFDGRAWRRAARHRGRPFPSTPPDRRPGDLFQQILLLEPMSERVIFGMPEVLAASAGMQDLVARFPRNLRYLGEPRRLNYEVWSRPVVVDLPRLRADGGLRRLSQPWAQRWFTELPPELDGQIHALARSIAAAEPTAYDKARRLEAWLREGFAYTSVPEAGTLGQPLSEFLFETRRGHCEYFATALAVMLRSLDVPAVVVNGFYGGEYNELGEFITLRQSDAHSWVEVWVGAEGWVGFDATPEGSSRPAPGFWSQLAGAVSRAWRQRVVDFDLDDQLALLNLPSFELSATGSGLAPLSPLVPVGVLLLVVAVVPGVLRGLVLREPRRASAQGVEALLHRGWRLVRRRGWEVPDALPAVSAAEWLLGRAGPTAEPMLRLAWCHYRVRYGGAEEHEMLPEALRHLRALRTLVREG